MFLKENFVPASPLLSSVRQESIEVLKTFGERNGLAREYSDNQDIPQPSQLQHQSTDDFFNSLPNFLDEESAAGQINSFTAEFDMLSDLPLIGDDNIDDGAISVPDCTDTSLGGSGLLLFFF